MVRVIGQHDHHSLSDAGNVVVGLTVVVGGVVVVVVGLTHVPF